jgi:hypothetical protein
MICTDLDGTLLQSNHEISDKDKEAIRKAKEQGVIIVLATGRMHMSARLFAEQLDIWDPIISSNGSFVTEREGDKVFFESNLREEDLRYIIDTLKEYDVESNFYNRGTMYVNEVRDFVKRYEALQKVLPKDKNITIRYINETYTYEDLIREDGTRIQKGICFPPLELIEPIKKRMRENRNIKIVSSGPNIEFTSKDADKGLAALRLAEHFGISREEMICIGDSENDLSMLSVAGMPVAMGNAIDEVKSLARFVTADNNSGGVARMIGKFILGEDEEC